MLEAPRSFLSRRAWSVDFFSALLCCPMMVPCCFLNSPRRRLQANGSWTTRSLAALERRRGLTLLGPGPPTVKNPQLDFQNVATDCGHHLTILNIWWWSSWLLLRRGVAHSIFPPRKYCRREVLEENVIDAEMLKRIDFFRSLASSCYILLSFNRCINQQEHVITITWSHVTTSLRTLPLDLGIFGHLWSLIAEMPWFSHVFSRS